MSQEQWLFPFQGKRVLPRRLAYLAQVNNMECPNLLCPCCGQTMSAWTVARHYYQSHDGAGAEEMEEEKVLEEVEEDNEEDIGEEMEEQ